MDTVGGTVDDDVGSGLVGGNAAGNMLGATDATGASVRTVGLDGVGLRVVGMLVVFALLNDGRPDGSLERTNVAVGDVVVMDRGNVVGALVMTRVGTVVGRVVVGPLVGELVGDGVGGISKHCVKLLPSKGRHSSVAASQTLAQLWVASAVRVLLSPRLSTTIAIVPLVA